MTPSSSLDRGGLRSFFSRSCSWMRRSSSYRLIPPADGIHRMPRLHATKCSSNRDTNPSSVDPLLRRLMSLAGDCRHVSRPCVAKILVSIMAPRQSPICRSGDCRKSSQLLALVTMSNNQSHILARYLLTARRICGQVPIFLAFRRNCSSPSLR